MTLSPRARLGAALAGLALLLAGCGTADGESGGDESGLEVLASFYPLQYLADRVGGDRVSVTTLTPPNVDPHNLEVSPRTVSTLESAELVVYLSGFQPAVDEAVELTGVTAFDAAEHANLLTPDAHDHADDDHGHDDHAHGPQDPHFWLDPIRMAEVTDALAATLAETDPDGAETYRANAAELTAELATLDEEYRSAVGQCEQDTIVVAHEAYGYLGAAYGLHQEGLSGIDPDAEPSPARLAEISAVLEETGGTTIFTEALISSTVSEALAADLGVTTAVLDPLENQQGAGADYLDVMRANLAALQDALGCR
ncbi:metal ABC transporter substrate-binding protein [Georgenia sp. MJ173]|uniref:metal ABC transporter substrate-binding protein n=1 Tax=Georgenia sunbinii TaxID=3117728 RepID=UPI002F26C20D